MSSAEAICTVLEEAGIDLVLGIPGGDVMRIYDALHDRRSTIRTVLVRQESLASVMAEAYGRSSGKPAVVLAQGDWILSYAAMGALEAFTGSAPLVFLTDMSDKTPWSQQAPAQTGTGHYGTWDAHVAFRGFTKQVFEARDPAQAGPVTQLAIKHAMAGCPGPTMALFHANALSGRVTDATRPILYPTAGVVPVLRGGYDHAAVARAGGMLKAARAPVIVAGNGVRVGQAFAALRQLAEHLDAPVVTTTSGKGVFAETHPLAAGVVGDYGLNAAADLVKEADVVLAVGTRLAPGDTMKLHPGIFDPARQSVIHIDIEERHIGWNLPVNAGLLGDAAVVMQALVAAVPAARRNGAARVQRAAARGFFESVESASDARPILPQRLIRDLGQALPDDAMVSADAGENRIFMVHHFRSPGPNSLLQPGSMGGMGYAIPAAMGAKLAHPSRPSVAVCGDGGFGMGMNGLMTSLEEKLPIVVVVLNNGMLGWVAHVQGNRRIASTLGTYDHAAIARSMGCDGVRVTVAADFVPALQSALASGRTTVIDVVTSPDETWEKVQCQPS